MKLLFPPPPERLTPMLIVSAAPNALTVVATVLNRLCVVSDPTIVGFLRVRVPVVAPMRIAVPAPNASTVVA